MKIQNDTRIKLWIDLNTEISKWIHQGEQIIFMGECIGDTLEVKKNGWKHRDSLIQYTIYTGIQMLW